MGGKKASSIDLILLGMIRNQPMSPYELSRHTGVFDLVKISVPAVYKNLRRLASAGFLDYLIVKKGKMPEKKIYRLSESGEEYFQNLLLACTQNPVNFYFDFNVSMLMINAVSKKDGKSLIDDTRHQLEEKRNYLQDQIEKYKNLPFPVAIMAEQQLDLCNTLLSWLNKFEAEYDDQE